jgi:peptide chain release factor 1
VEDRPGFAVLCVAGRGAATLFGVEAGGHRWQRVPPTEKRGRVQTSTITVAVLEEPRQIELTIRLEDVDLETMRGSGAGGQHRNKTDSAVRARHRPTGIEVRVEAERSQHANKELAMRVLAARVAERDRAAADGARAEDRRRMIGTGMRGDKRRTIRVQDDQVNDHIDGRTWKFKAYARGDWTDTLAS